MNPSKDPSHILPDVTALVADHGLIAELEAVVGVEHCKVGADQAPETVVQVDPGGVAGDGDVTYPDLGSLEVASRNHGDRDQHLVRGDCFALNWNYCG